MKSTLSLLALLLAAPSAVAGPWPHWRGPTFNGSAEETDLPERFSADEHVAWTVDLAGIGGSTPVVWGGHVFVSAMDPKSERSFAECFDRTDGSLRWRKEIGAGFANRQGNTAASPSPVTDGSRVWFLYGTGDLVAFTAEGRELWRRHLQEDHGTFEMLWEYAASPLLWQDRLYVAVIHGRHRGKGGEDKSYLLCIDPATGRDLWKQPRPSTAVAEAKQAYTTPVPFAFPDGSQILVAGADHVTAHDAATGRETWRSPDYNPEDERTFRQVASPVVSGRLVLACTPRGKGDLFAAKVGWPGWTWTHRGAPDVPTPLAYRGRFYVLHGVRKTLTAIEAESGRVLGRTKLDTKSIFQASPTGADGRIYLLSHAGEVFVLEATPEMPLLHRTSLGGNGCRATIAASDGQLFIRTDRKLYCVGGTDGQAHRP